MSAVKIKHEHCQFGVWSAV